MRNKVAIVTGAAQGIGRGIAEVLLCEGCRVALVDWNEEQGRRTVEELAATYSNGGDALDATLAGEHLTGKDRLLFLQADVSKPEDIQRITEETAAKWGGIDILVSNVGTHYYRSIDQVTVEDWDRVIATDLRGHFLGAKEALPYMKSRGGGSIVHIASIHAVQSLAHASVYAAAKGGITAMSRSLALEFASFGIRVNTILPGKTRNSQDDSRLAKVPQEQRADKEKEMASNIPLGRIAEAVEIGEVAAFLASDKASFMTGATLHVDGGESAHLYWRS